MLPSILARQLQQGLADYIKTTFPMTNPVFQGSIDNMLETKGSVLHDPYVAVRLPFRVASESAYIFDSIHPQYKPYVHQQKAFERLTGEEGESTLIATGTGSGKTECFLYPILEYCYQYRGEPGIKALIIYPMNALATDQAKRIAELIYNSPELHGNLTAGMYVGGYEKNPCRVMSEQSIITEHETMLSSPPDILLTNYKMLDYLLVRPKDAALWKENKPETLKYIAVDELHTFDGAQGTDLACLLRRLKARLYTPSDYLCCIGTSATMGVEDNAENIREYAETVFGEPFGKDSVISEDRLSPEEFFSEYEVADFTIPNQDDINILESLYEEDNQSAYLLASTESWFDDTFKVADIMSNATRIAIGQRLMLHNFTRNIIDFMGGNYVQTSNFYDNLKRKYPAITEIKDFNVAIDALSALISHARAGTEDKVRPFLNVQVQLWMRELRRLLAKVSKDDVTYSLATDLNDQQAKQYLPVVNCRDCGETGWVSVINERNNVTMTDLNTFYNLYFNQNSKVIMMFPHEHDWIPNDMLPARLCPSCLQFHPGEAKDSYCSSCGSDTIPVLFPRNNISGNNKNKHYVCSFCGSNHGLSIIGLRSATAISASVSQLFASKFNDDKKTLAFSDNVQDAAHRAGFFNSRTWRFGLRSAIQHFAHEAGDALSLAEFSSKFIEYWHKQSSDEEFVSFFIAPNMTWMQAFEKMKAENRLSKDKESNKLIFDIKQRLKYEIMLEYGLRSHIGRTLEKSACSSIGFNHKSVIEVAKTVKERTINELGCLDKTEEIAFERMVIGFLNIMRSNGAFNDSVFNVYTVYDGKNYLLSNKQEKWMPGLRAGRTPRFIHEPKERTKRLYSFDLYTHAKYIDWLESCTDAPFLPEKTFENIAKIILQELIRKGIVVSMPSSPGYNIWALDKNKVIVSTKVKQFVCDTCGTITSVIEEGSDIWDGAPCLIDRCNGNLVTNDDYSLDYYGKLYSEGDMIRVFSREHTGLLERDDREELERTFKRRNSEKKPWDTNLLSCTPTLEMGIDIGDLSTVILCSIPPTQAQYLQRAGRGGRKDGNSLTVAVANARPHDLYFYADPMDMLAGIIVPPKIFLRASAVLERQFVAYSMDCWIKKGVPEKAIPKHVGVCLSKMTSKPKNLFPFNFLNFVQNNLSDLLRDFEHMFAQDLDEETISDLKKFSRGERLADSPMHMKVYHAFENLKKQRDSLKESIKQLKSLIKELEGKPQDSSYDEEIRELKGELTALLNVVRNLNNNDVFNFLSDEGLLPNYAFPEAGIILKAILYRKGDNVNKYEKMIYEYNRSASTAISEFAPSNNFYVQGRKLTIDQIDLTTAQTAKWRLCPNCSHAQLEETGRDIAACPQCGDPLWGDSGQVRTMLKVQMVYSNMDYTKSLINDESEDRNSTFYCKQMLVDVNENEDILKAYQMDNHEFSFGYEFVKKATLREINFGESDIVGEKLTVAGVEDIRKGFKVCKYCGKIQPESGNPVHTYTCRARDNQLINSEAFEECLFLYREFLTEALRILIPATTLDTSKIRQESFIAAFMFGMKEYFGNVDHLRVCLSEVPVPDAGYRKQYLVIYDSVPGGTGYLKQLLQHDNAFVEVLEKALLVLENCSCKNDPQKDGCYHCLYAYRQSQSIGQISRITAINLLKLILSGKENIQEIPKLSSVPTNPLFESELERKFIEALDRMGNKSRKIKISKELVNNKDGYLLKIEDNLWEIEPQFLLDSEYNVSVKSRADFVLWPKRTSGNHKPVAIFTDGFMYHKDIAAADTLKREAIRRSSKFRIWILSWKDVQSVFAVLGDYATNTLIPEKMPYGIHMYRPIVKQGEAEILQPDKVNTFELLLQYLENKDAEELFSVHANAYSLSLIEPSNYNNSIAYADWKNLIDPVADVLELFDYNIKLNNTFFGKWSPRSSEAQLTILAGVEASDMQKNKTDAIVAVCAILDDIKDNRTEKYEAEWNGFWQFFNVMQFLQNFAVVTKDGINQSIYNAIPVQEVEIAGHELKSEHEFTVDDSWKDIMEQIFDETAAECAEKLMSTGVQAPSIVGYELLNSSGTVIAECEMAWESDKIALLLPYQMSGIDKFKKNGWTVVTPDDLIIEFLHRGDER